MDTLWLLVRFVEELSKLNVPIVVRGAIALKAALSGSPVSTSRETRDVDLDWIGSLATSEQLYSAISQAVTNMGLGMTAVLNRELAPDRTAGFDVLSKDGKREFQIDAWVEKLPYSCIYVTANGVRFNGSTAQRMIVDKMCTVSTHQVRRRMKDVYDLFLLSALTGYTTFEIYQICNELGRKFGDFSVFMTDVATLERIWSKFKGVTNKPDFQTLYNRVYILLYPFCVRANVNMMWNGNAWVMC